MKINVILATLALAASAASYAEEAKPGLKIIKVYGDGEGCLTDDDNNPVDWNVTINNKPKNRSIVLNFFNFKVDPDQKSSNCSVQALIEFPKGYTTYFYESQVFGTADVAQGEHAVFTTSLGVAGRIHSMDNPYLISDKVQGSWQTPVETYKRSASIGCGGGARTIDYNMILTLKGNNSEVQISQKQGRLTNVKFDFEKCD